MAISDAAPEDGRRPSRGGRRRDASKDAVILDAAIDVLAEAGYGGLTMDLVAARASAGKATLYRRWASKDDLVLGAVARMREGVIALPALPDTGDLRGDLLALFRPDTAAVGRRRATTLAALASLPRDDRFAGAVHSVLVEPWADAHRQIMDRAAARGQVRPDADVEALCHVLPEIAAYRYLVLGRAFDEQLLLALVDGVLVPALVAPPR